MPQGMNDHGWILAELLSKRNFHSGTGSALERSTHKLHHQEHDRGSRRLCFDCCPYVNGLRFKKA